MSNLTVGSISGIPSNNYNINVENGSKLVQPGMVLQVLSAVSGPVRQVISSTSPVGVNGLSIQIIPKFSNSIILIQAQVSTNAPHVWSLGIFKNGIATVSTAGQANNNEPNMQVTGYWGSDVIDNIYTVPVFHHEVSGSTEQRTYQVFATAGWGGGARSMQINNRNSNDMASFSYMNVMEIAQ